VHEKQLSSSLRSSEPRQARLAASDEAVDTRGEREWKGGVAAGESARSEKAGGGDGATD
jgi:hypothetical protein